MKKFLSIVLFMLALASYGQHHLYRGGYARSCYPMYYRPPVVYAQPPVPVIRYYQQPAYCAGLRWVWVPMRDGRGCVLYDRFGNIRYQKIFTY